MMMYAQFLRGREHSWAYSILFFYNPIENYLDWGIMIWARLSFGQSIHEASDLRHQIGEIAQSQF